MLAALANAKVPVKSVVKSNVGHCDAQGATDVVQLGSHSESGSW